VWFWANWMVSRRSTVLSNRYLDYQIRYAWTLLLERGCRDNSRLSHSLGRGKLVASSKFRPDGVTQPCSVIYVFTIISLTLIGLLRVVRRLRRGQSARDGSDQRRLIAPLLYYCETWIESVQH
jgi:hypothetical protein